MRKSRLSQYKQNKLIELFVTGVTARTAAQLVGVNKNTAAYYFHRLRLLIFHNTQHLYQPKLKTGTYPHKIKEQIINTIQSPNLP